MARHYETPEDRAAHRIRNPADDHQLLEQVDDIEGQSFAQWWDEMHHQAKKAGNGQAFKEAVERDHHLLARAGGNNITLHSAAGAYATDVDPFLTGAATEKEFENFVSSIQRNKLPTADEARQANDRERVKEFWSLADQSAEAYKSAIEGAGYVLAKQDDKILVVTPAGVLDDLKRLTPASTARGDDISDYKKLIAPFDIQKLPSVPEAQAIQDQRKGLEPEIEALKRNISARQAREALDLSDRQALQIHGDPPHWLAERHLQEREKQDQEFAQERDRYIREYKESRNILDEIRDRAKQEALELGDKLREGPKFSR